MRPPRRPRARGGDRGDLARRPGLSCWPSAAGTACGWSGPTASASPSRRSALDATFAARSAAAGQRRAGRAVRRDRHRAAGPPVPARASACSSFASVGDKYDVSSNDMLMWWEQDEPDQAGRAVRGVVRQPAQVRPDRAPRRPADAGADRPRRPVRRRASGPPRRTPRRPRPRWSPRRRCSSRRASSPRAASVSSIGAAALLACQPLPAGDRVGDRVQRGRGRGAGRRRLRGQRPAGRRAVRGDPAAAAQAAARPGPRWPGRSTPPPRSPPPVQVAACGRWPGTTASTRCWRDRAYRRGGPAARHRGGRHAHAAGRGVPRPGGRSTAAGWRLAGTGRRPQQGPGTGRAAGSGRGAGTRAGPGVLLPGERGAGAGPCRPLPRLARHASTATSPSCRASGATTPGP